MSKCRLSFCHGKAEWRAGYNGYCSLECRDRDEYEQDIEQLKRENAELREQIRKLLSDMAVV